MVMLEVTVLEPLMLVTTLVMMLTLADDEDCEGEEVVDLPEDELVDPPTLFRLVSAALFDDDCEPDEDDVGVEDVEDDGGVEEEEEGGEIEPATVPF